MSNEKFTETSTQNPSESRSKDTNRQAKEQSQKDNAKSISEQNIIPKKTN